MQPPFSGAKLDETESHPARSCYRRRMPPPDSTAPTQAAAIRVLAARGYDEVTVAELADAVGMSRATFFRRFGGKDDVVFADHEVALATLEALLGESGLDVVDAVARAAARVLEHLTRDREAAQLRSGLLRHTPALREHELVIAHRYERVFDAYLARAAQPGTPAWVPVALAAGIVAVHNAVLRRWLREPDPREFVALDAELRQLVARFAPWFGGERAPSRVTVAVFDADASPAEVMLAIDGHRGIASEVPEGPTS